jgi:hypothetical protein
MKDENNYNLAGLGKLLEVFLSAIESEDMNRASMAMNSMWLSFHIAHVQKTSDLQELTYIKAPAIFSNGGTYNLSLVHVDGPKIQLKDAGTGIAKPTGEIK